MEQKKIKQEGERPQLFIKKGKSIVVIYPTHTRGRGRKGERPDLGGTGGRVSACVCVEFCNIIYLIFFYSYPFYNAFIITICEIKKFKSK